jgi:hypothetical protein
LELHQAQIFSELLKYKNAITLAAEHLSQKICNRVEL